MSNKRIEDILKNKLEGKQYAYDDAYWKSAKEYIDSQSAQGAKGAFWWFSSWMIWALLGSAALLGVGMYFSINPFTNSANDITSATKTQKTSENMANLRVETIQEEGENSQSVVEKNAQETGFTSKKPKNITYSFNQESVIHQNSISSSQSKNSFQESTRKNASSSLGNTQKSNAEKAVLTTLQPGTKQSLIDRNENAEQGVVASNRNGAESLLNEFSSRKLVRKLTLASKDFSAFSVTTNLKDDRINEFSLPRLNLWAVGVYGSYHVRNNSDQGRFSIGNQYQYSYGAMGEYAMKNGMHIQLGAGYSTENFHLTIEPDFTIKSAEDWQINSTNQVVYDFEFQNGIPLSVDSNYITVYDSILVTRYDTLYSDSVKNTVRSNYQVQRIEIPMAVKFYKSFGHYEFFGATGINWGILVNAQPLSKSENSVSVQNQVNFLSVNGTLRLGGSLYLTDRLKWSVAASSQYELIESFELVNRKRFIYGVHSSLIYRW